MESTLRYMNSRLNLLALLAFLLTPSCATPKVIQDYQRDSVRVVIRDSVRFRDSLVLVPVPSGSDKDVVEVSDTSRLETDIAESAAWVSNGRLYHTLRNKDAMLIPITIKVPERIHIESRDKLVYHKIVETVEVEKELSKWQRFLLTLGYVVLIGAVVWLAWKIYRLVKI